MQMQDIQKRQGEGKQPYEKPYLESMSLVADQVLSCMAPATSCTEFNPVRTPAQSSL
jgi:hypothetical protein